MGFLNFKLRSASLTHDLLSGNEVGNKAVGQLLSPSICQWIREGVRQGWSQSVVQSDSQKINDNNTHDKCHEQQGTSSPS